MQDLSMTILSFLFVLICLQFINCSPSVDEYAVVIDAGSTGSRCFVFHVTIDPDDNRNVSSVSCGKVMPGLSSFAAFPQKVVPYVVPLLQNAANSIPYPFQSKTAVYIKATAGMRLLTPENQSAIWEHLVQGINQRNDIPFSIIKENVGIIDGHDEAFYAVLASNYIAGSIDGNLRPIEGRPLLGALDMGGSSTQLIFYNGTTDSKKMDADDFWSHSWLNYGLHKVHQRVLDYLYDTNLQKLQAMEKDDNSKECESFTILNPCGFKGQRQSYLSYITFEGTGQGEECLNIIEKVIWPDLLSKQEQELACLRGRPCPIDEIEHPSVEGHHFYAMSAYYFTLDCMKTLGPAPLQHWPTPNLEELETAAFQFCGLEWETVLGDLLGSKPHPYTKVELLPNRCFEALYIITLLEKGFAFGRHSRTITYALEVDGSEVEWTLGFALAEIDFRPHALDVSLSGAITYVYEALQGLSAPFVSMYKVATTQGAKYLHQNGGKK